MKNQVKKIRAALASLSLAALFVSSASVAFSSDAMAADAVSIAMITHATAGDTFWTVVENGAKQAAQNLGATLTYQAANGDVHKQVEMINAAVAQHPSAIVLSLSDPSAFAPAIKRAAEAGIPVFSLNSGIKEYTKVGSLGHAGEDEYVAGEGVGKRFNDLGTKHLLCVLHEQGNIGLENYCNGVKSTFSGQYEAMYVAGTKDIAGSMAAIRAKLAGDPSLDGMYVLSAEIAPVAVTAAEAAGSHVKIANWSLTPTVLKLIGSGKLLFAEDQQPWLQGYLATTSAILYAKYRFDPGAAILTGPNFVTKEQVPLLQSLVKEAIR